MIFYGKKASVLRKEQFFGLKCPNCQSTNTVHGAVVGSYGHLYWIPTFPMGKTVVAQCENCRKTFNEAEMSPEMKQAITPMLNEVKTPIKFYSGLIVIVGLIALGAFISINGDRENLKYIAAPAVGDVYNLKIDYREYTTQKVVRVTADSVFCAENQYSVNKQRGLYDIEKEKNYTTSEVGYSLVDLKKMLDDKKIISVKR